jgi:exonuclease SbcD
MKILHTADWHLGDRLGRQDRTEDLQRAIERIARYCEQEKADVLLVAGDLFSELSRPDGLRASIDHLNDVFLPFLSRGGTIVALTGNHDNEIFSQTLRSVLSLAAPSPLRSRGRVDQSGRLYLATGPTLLRLADSTGQQVQFLLMPYPTPARYLEGESDRYRTLQERNRLLQEGFTRRLNAILADGNAFDPSLPTVLSAHIHVQGSCLANLFRIAEDEDVVFPASDVPAGMAYVALGHIHKPQEIGGLAHVRYAGSIDRLDLGERQDEKSVCLVELGSDGLHGAPVLLPLPATPIYEVDIRNPREALPRLRRQYPDADSALVRYRLVWTAGVDDREALLRELSDIFPRWYDREVVEALALQGGYPVDGFQPGLRSFPETVREYLQAELADYPDGDREAVLELAEEFLSAESAPVRPVRKRGRVRATVTEEQG